MKERGVKKRSNDGDDLRGHRDALTRWDGGHWLLIAITELQPRGTPSTGTSRRRRADTARIAHCAGRTRRR